MPAGRPTKYRDEFPAQAEKLSLLGATDAEMADFFGVNVLTIYRWKLKHDAFCNALKVGKEHADARVERSLFQRAIGYQRPAVKIFMPAGADSPVYADYIEDVTPDTTAAIFWLKNRKQAEWRDRQELDHTASGPLSDFLTAIAGRTAKLGKADSEDEKS